ADRGIEVYSKHHQMYLRNNAIGNNLDLCAVSVPSGFTSQGMPIGLMIYGKPHAEATVLRAAYAYEQATEWHTRVPDLSWAAAGAG
ncbi:MAG: amidase family protein, partial [SAR324 cluster bacterium]|nr:amidase family protein [SAR324 cluster bacterium]